MSQSLRKKEKERETKNEKKYREVEKFTELQGGEDEKANGGRVRNSRFEGGSGRKKEKE